MWNSVPRMRYCGELFRRGRRSFRITAVVGRRRRLQQWRPKERVMMAMKMFHRREWWRSSLLRAKGVGKLSSWRIAKKKN